MEHSRPWILGSKSSGLEASLTCSEDARMRPEGQTELDMKTARTGQFGCFQILLTFALGSL